MIAFVRIPFNLLMYALFYIYFDHMLTPRYKQSRRILLFIFIGVIPFVLEGLTELLPGRFSAFRLLSGFIGGFLFVFVAYKDPLSKKCYVYLSQFLILEIGEIAALVIAFVIEGNIFDIDSIALTTFSISVSIDIAVQAVLYLMVILIWKKRLYQIRSGAISTCLLFPLSQVVSLCCVVWIILGKMDITIVICIAVLITVCVVSDIALLYIIRDISRLKELEIKNLYLEEQKILQMRHYEELQRQYADIRRLKHDIVNHLRTVQVLTERGDSENAKLYANEVQKNYEQIEATSYCPNCIIDAILCDKLQMAQKHEIQVSTALQLPKQIPIADIDLVCIWCNLLDNAIEACSLMEATQERLLQIKAYIKFYNLVVVIENTYTRARNTSSSPKSYNAPHFGIGQEIVRGIVERYDGTFTAEHEMGRYRAQVIIPIPDTPHG